MVSFICKLNLKGSFLGQDRCHVIYIVSKKLIIGQKPETFIARTVALFANSTVIVI
jgi:hypothetical protein